MNEYISNLIDKLQKIQDKCLLEQDKKAIGEAIGQLSVQFMDKPKPTKESYSMVNGIASYWRYYD